MIKTWALLATVKLGAGGGEEPFLSIPIHTGASHPTFYGVWTFGGFPFQFKNGEALGTEMVRTAGTKVSVGFGTSR
jgi:hypothetical protein